MRDANRATGTEQVTESLEIGIWTGIIIPKRCLDMNNSNHIVKVTNLSPRLLALSLLLFVPLFSSSYIHLVSLLVRNAYSISHAVSE